MVMGRPRQNQTRNYQILKCLEDGEKLKDIATKFGLTSQRIWVIGADQGFRFTKLTDQVNCKTCDIPFTRSRTEIKNKKKHCCNQCGWKSVRKPGGQFSRFGFITLTCAGCGRAFKRSNRFHSIILASKRNKYNDESLRHYFCTRPCYDKHGKDFCYMT